MFEALLAVEAGQPVDDVLADFARIDPAIYRRVGADFLSPVADLWCLPGGRCG